MAKSISTRVKSNQFYHSGIQTSPVPTLEELELLAQPLGTTAALNVAENFTIKFTTETCAPNHIVTLRIEVDGWKRDIYGSYRDGAWQFTLEKARYQNGIVFKFMLDHCHWSKGMNLSLPGPIDASYDENQIQFETIEPRFRHYYDNLQVSENNLQQLMMHANHDESVDYEMIVVGSGMAGGVLGMKAAQLGRKVLILDAGRLEYSTHTFNLPHSNWRDLPRQHGVGNYTKMDKTFIGEYPTMNLGGRSVFWYGIIPRMKDWELAFWPPAVAAALKQGGYDAAEALLKKHLTTGPLQESLIPQLQALFPNNLVCDTPRSEHQPNVGASSFVEQSTGTFSTAELLYDALSASGPLGRDKLFVNLNHLVTRLEFTGSKITHVVCQDLMGNRQRVYHAKAVILAAGSIESPKIALRSGLDNPNNRTGVGLTDHGSFFCRQGFEIPAGSTYDGKDKYARIFLYADATAQHRFNTEVELNGEDYFRVRHANVAYWNDLQQKKNRTTLTLKTTCATPLVDANYVKLAVIQDDKVALRMEPTSFGEETRPSVEALWIRLLNFFGVQNFELKNNMYFGNGGTPHHAGGSMRMTADSSGVVNTDLRHESYDNLYVCDASVSPFIPAANPSLTLVALALRLASHLHNVLP